jgi:hypothetical protein
MTTECIGETRVTLAEKLSEYLSAKVPGFHLQNILTVHSLV